MAVYFASVKATQPKPLAGTWAELKALLQHHEENPNKTDGALWSPIEYYPGSKRGNKGVRFIEALVVDMDGEAFDNAKLDGLEWFAYSTYSHRNEDPHYHLVLPLAERVPAGLWRAVWLGLHERLQLQGDPQTKDPARLFYLPQHAPDQPYEFHEGHGALLDADFNWETEHRVHPTQIRTARQPRQRQQQCVMLSEEWWNSSTGTNRWSELNGKAKYQAMLDEFTALMNSVGGPE
jgi:hypothetical protein